MKRIIEFEGGWVQLSPHEPVEDDTLWTEADIRRWLGVSKTTFWRLLRKPGFPQPVQHVRRWRKSEVQRFILGG